ncbi:CAP domain-containing protein [Planomonospora sp. ID67723]|uniref:CAP domain-containing protein n=1 Tax=Planomonospora sp. ID67723 TaxID=2738134 RepID=UPI0018C42CAF|nr:CAP domain-containing protein [Planomonospora sp. ID67723]MBG0827760.1 CAP domain-containing protein [Planomonospora sp. ID67723]
MTVLVVGFVLGRGSRGEELPDRVYLNDAPATPSPSREVRAGRAVGQRAPLGRVARRTPAPETPQDRLTPRAPNSPRNAIEGSPGDEDSRYVIRGQQGPAGAPALSLMEREVVRLTNAAREQAGCAPFKIDVRLVRSARVHSAEMASSGLFSHDSPDGSSPWDRMEGAGYFDGGAENIGRGSTSAEEAVRSWMASSGHRRNILNCALTATGVGVVDGSGGPWWTQDFGYS